MKKLSAILKEAERDMMVVLERQIAKELDVAYVRIDGINTDREWSLSFKKIVIDDYQITNVRVDQYSNLNCSIGSKFPVEYLPKFGRIVSELYPLLNYPGRPNYSLHVEYWRKFGHKLNELEIKSMLKTGKGDVRTSFREWYNEYVKNT